MTKTTLIERKELSVSEPATHMDRRLIDTWVAEHPYARIVSCLHATRASKYLLIIYEEAELAA